MRRPAIAKLSPPRSHDAIPRERLHALLDRGRSHPCVWLCGPPGSGKTTLLTNWIEQRRLPCIWYRVDAGDADAATLFSNLVMSVARRRKGGKGLPYLSADYRRDLATFAGRFFRAYFQFLAPGSVLVFDNLHEAAGSELPRVSMGSDPRKHLISRSKGSITTSRPSLGGHFRHGNV